MTERVRTLSGLTSDELKSEQYVGIHQALDARFSEAFGLDFLPQSEVSVVRKTSGRSATTP